MCIVTPTLLMLPRGSCHYKCQLLTTYSDIYGNRAILSSRKKILYVQVKVDFSVGLQ